VELFKKVIKVDVFSEQKLKFLFFFFDSYELSERLKICVVVHLYHERVSFLNLFLLDRQGEYLNLVFEK